MLGRRRIRSRGPEDGLHSFVCDPQSMRLAVLLVLAACAASAVSRDGSNEPQDKPDYAQTEAPDKQVEYVTGPNVGVVGPTVLGGKGQEVQPSGEELQSADKEQRDVSAHYSGYQQISAQQEEATYPKYSYGEGVKYIHRQEPAEQTEKESLQKKNQVIQIGNADRPKVTYYQSGGSYQQPTQSEPNYYQYIPVSQNQELSSAQLLARSRTHQLSQLLKSGPFEYQQVAAQNHGQEESGISQSQAEKSSSHEAHSTQGQQAPATNASPVYIPQEYLQYQIAAAQEDLHSTLQSPGKHLLQLFLPQEATSGHFNVEAQQPQVASINPNLQPIPNGHQIQYIPTYYPSQSPLPIQKAHHPAPQNPTAQIIRPNQEVPQPATNIQNAHSSSAVIPPTYQRPQHHQLYSNFQPSQHQSLSPFPNEPTQYQQSNEAAKRPQHIYHQTKQTAQPTQHAQKPIATKPSNTYIQSHGQPTTYRPKTPERLPQQQPENLALVSQSQPKTTQHRQTHDKPPQLLQSQQRPQVLQHHDRPEAAQSHDRPQSFQPHDRPQVLQSHQVYQAESIQPTDYKLSALQNNPYTIQKLQSPLQIQSPTPFPIKVVPLQSQAQIPLTYQLPSDKDVAFRPIIYPVATPFGQAVQTEAPQSLSLIPTEAAKLYNVKIPSYIKTLEQAGHSKPFGFSQMSYGQTPGSYSYSIFNKHS